MDYLVSRHTDGSLLIRHYDPHKDEWIVDLHCDCKTLSDLEYERCKVEHPSNPAYNMRPMFYTNSPYGKELLELSSEGRPNG